MAKMPHEKLYESITGHGVHEAGGTTGGMPQRGAYVYHSSPAKNLGQIRDAGLRGWQPLTATGGKGGGGGDHPVRVWATSSGRVTEDESGAKEDALAAVHGAARRSSAANAGYAPAQPELQSAREYARSVGVSGDEIAAAEEKGFDRGRADAGGPSGRTDPSRQGGGGGGDQPRDDKGRFAGK